MLIAIFTTNIIIPNNSSTVSANQGPLSLKLELYPENRTGTLISWLWTFRLKTAVCSSTKNNPTPAKAVAFESWKNG